MKVLLCFLFFLLPMKAQYDLRSSEAAFAAGFLFVNDLASSANPSTISDINYFRSSYFKLGNLDEINIKSITVYYRQYGLEFLHLGFDLFSDSEIRFWKGFQVSDNFTFSILILNKTSTVQNFSSFHNQNMSASFLYQYKSYFFTFDCIHFFKTDWFDRKFQFSFLQSLDFADIQFSFRKTSYFEDYLSMIKVKLVPFFKFAFAYNFASEANSAKIDLDISNWRTSFNLENQSDFGIMYSISVAIFF